MHVVILWGECLLMSWRIQLNNKITSIVAVAGAAFYGHSHIVN